MNPIILQIRRKTRVPTKKQIVHMYRSDWKIVGKIDYPDSRRLFKTIGGGPIEKDSQFAKLVYDSYGPGIYSVMAWRKGLQGMWSFFMLEVTPINWRRLPKNQTKKEKEKQEYRQEVAKIKKQHDTDSDSKELKEELDFLKEIYSMDGEEGKKSKRGPMGYLKQTIPIYKTHAYEDYNVQKNLEDVEANGFW